MDELFQTSTKQACAICSSAGRPCGCSACGVIPWTGISYSPKRRGKLFQAERFAGSRIGCSARDVGAKRREFHPNIPNPPLKLQPDKVWRARFDQINAFEKHLTENRVILLKFFLHISKKEQAERLQSRLDNPHKNWKFEQGDLAMRAKWNDFQKAYEDVLNRCSTSWAPWHIIPADRKWHRDYFIAKTVVDALENLELKWPKPKEDLSKIKII